MSHSLIVATIRTEAEARRLGLALVQARLAAAVNIQRDVSSFYWWGGEVCEAEEALLLVKTRRDLVGQVVTRLKAEHAYEVPAIVALPIEAGNQDYLDWIDRETRGP
ncbi:MAG: divalent-cation tolerance protein CutA [Pseudomonadota bacterium]